MDLSEATCPSLNGSGKSIRFGVAFILRSPCFSPPSDLLVPDPMVVTSSASGGSQPSDHLSINGLHQSWWGPSPQPAVHLSSAHWSLLDPSCSSTSTQMLPCGQGYSTRDSSSSSHRTGDLVTPSSSPPSDCTWARFRSTTQVSMEVGLRSSTQNLSNLHVHKLGVAWHKEYAHEIPQGFSPCQVN